VFTNSLFLFQNLLVTLHWCCDDRVDPQ